MYLLPLLIVLDLAALGVTTRALRRAGACRGPHLRLVGPPPLPGGAVRILGTAEELRSARRRAAACEARTTAALVARAAREPRDHPGDPAGAPATRLLVLHHGRAS